MEKAGEKMAGVEMKVKKNGTIISISTSVLGYFTYKTNYKNDKIKGLTEIFETDSFKLELFFIFKQ